MPTKIDISSLDTETKTKLDHYVELARELVEGIPVEIPIRRKLLPVFRWEEGDTGFITPKPTITFINDLDWEHLAKQEKDIEDKYNALIKEICDFSDSVADTIGVDKQEFFRSVFM